MAKNDLINKELEQIINIPTVTVTKDGIPYEFKESGSSARLRCRRFLSDNYEIPFELYQMLIDQDATFTQLLEFSSGSFIHFLHIKSNYA